MIRVWKIGEYWRWAMICEHGRILAYDGKDYPCDFSAFDAARAYRTAFWQASSEIDHRMGACI